MLNRQLDILAQNGGWDCMKKCKENEYGDGEGKRRIKNDSLGTFLAVQWLRLCASNARGVGLIPGWGTKIPQAAQYGREKKKKKE